MRVMNFFCMAWNERLRFTLFVAVMGALSNFKSSHAGRAG